MGLIVERRQWDGENTSKLVQKERDNGSSAPATKWVEMLDGWRRMGSVLSLGLNVFFVRLSAYGRTIVGQRGGTNKRLWRTKKQKDLGRAELL
jgi:hypothetical protein